jgi:Tol biopolymer transport system component
MRCLIVICLSGFLFNYCFAQGSSGKQVNRYLKQAGFYFESEDYLNALNEYHKVLAIDKKNETAVMNALVSRMKLNQPVDSFIQYTERLQSFRSPEALFYLGKVNHKLKSFDVALEYLYNYKAIPERKRTILDEEVNYVIENCMNAKKEIAKPHRSVIKNIGEQINSAYPDYVPVVSPDESVLYFTSRRPGSTGDLKDPHGNYYEDVYVSYRENGKWSAAVNAGSPTNTETHDACVAVSPDGQRMIVYRTAPDIVTGDLYVTRMDTTGKWGPLEKYGSEINSQFIETSACFSNDTSEIYFSSNRPGGYGGKDIYRIKKLPNGRWGMPFNLGKEINTKHDEDDPFLHPDGITLFFSSKGHTSIGEYDVFKAELNTETNVFGLPQNLGYPINSVSNDRFFVLSGNGKRGYYSSVKEDSKGSSDIYVIDTRFGDNDLIVKHAIIYKGEVPGKAKITLLDNDSKQISGVFNSNARTGKFILVMNPVKSYKAIIEEEGFATMVLDLDPLSDNEEEKEIVIKLSKK